MKKTLCLLLALSLLLAALPLSVLAEDGLDDWDDWDDWEIWDGGSDLGWDDPAQEETEEEEE